MQPFFLFLNVLPKFSPICFWTLLLPSMRGFPGANYLPSVLLPQRCHPSHLSPLVNTVYFCTSFKIYFFCFSSFLRHILDPFLFPGAVHQVVSVLVITQHTLIKSSWWVCFPGVERLKPSEAGVLQSWGEFRMGVICRKWGLFSEWW